MESLSKVVAFLGKTDLDFKVRSQGYGNGTAKDVVISLTAFDKFEWDEESKIVTLGAGAKWQTYYDNMVKVAPDYHSKWLPSLGFHVSDSLKSSQHALPPSALVVQPCVLVSPG